MKKPMNGSSDTSNHRGSVWHRWDPHIHIPGTLHEDKFDGKNPDDEFIQRVNDIAPSIAETSFVRWP
tara:strand:- start:114 stop:314 length:201 start_codon:yes stop_codon:yes gene_type:complete